MAPYPGVPGNGESPPFWRSHFCLGLLPINTPATSLVSLNLEPADNRAATSPKTLGACTENRLCTSARNTRRRGPDYYFGGGGSFRLGRRLHPAGIATTAIFFSFLALAQFPNQVPP